MRDLRSKREEIFPASTTTSEPSRAERAFTSRREPQAGHVRHVPTLRISSRLIGPIPQGRSSSPRAHDELRHRSDGGEDRVRDGDGEHLDRSADGAALRVRRVLRVVGGAPGAVVRVLRRVRPVRAGGGAGGDRGALPLLPVRVAQHAGRRLRGAPDLHRRGVQEDVGQEEDPDPHLRLRVPRRQDPLQEGLPRHAVGAPRRVHRLAAVVEPVLVPALPAPAEPGRHPRGLLVVVAEGRGVDDEGDRRALRPRQRLLRRLPRCARARRPRNSGGAQFRRRQRSSSGAQFGLSAVHSLRLTSAAAAPPCAQARR